MTSGLFRLLLSSECETQWRNFSNRISVVISATAAAVRPFTQERVQLSCVLPNALDERGSGRHGSTCEGRNATLVIEDLRRILKANNGLSDLPSLVHDFQCAPVFCIGSVLPQFTQHMLLPRKRRSIA